jgi:hypothetical protein
VDEQVAVGGLASSPESPSGARAEKKALLCGATPEWPNAFRTSALCERSGSLRIAVTIIRLIANAILRSLVRHK